MANSSEDANQGEGESTKQNALKALAADYAAGEITTGVTVSSARDVQNALKEAQEAIAELTQKTDGLVQRVNLFLAIFGKIQSMFSGTRTTPKVQKANLRALQTVISNANVILNKIAQEQATMEQQQTDVAAMLKIRHEREVAAAAAAAAAAAEAGKSTATPKQRGRRKAS